MFLTDHWNIPAQITRWITASLLRDMLDTLFCYLSFNRQLIALLSVRCLRSIATLCHSLPWPHCVSNGWGKRRQTLTQLCFTGPFHIQRNCRKAKWKFLFCMWVTCFLLLFFFSLLVFIISIYKCLQLSEGLVRQSKRRYQQWWYALFIYSYHFDITHDPTHLLNLREVLHKINFVARDKN